MEFWIIMFVFLVLGGTCSLKGTCWDRKKKEKKNNQIWNVMLIKQLVLGLTAFSILKMISCDGQQKINKFLRFYETFS